MKNRTVNRRKVRLTFSSVAFFKKDYAASAAIALKKGWGQIGTEPYRPFIPVHRFAGCGFSVRLCCPRTGESIHCHSLGEANWGRILLWQEGHVQLFSQVAIPRQDSMRIAAKLGIKHPVYPDKTMAVMTTDFVHLSLVGGVRTFTAYSIKPSPQAIKQRKAQLLAIEKQYYRELGINWVLKFKHDADQKVLANIRFVEGFVGQSPLIWGSDRWNLFEPGIYAEVSLGLPLNRACQNAQKKLQMPRNTALTLVRFFIANRIWHIDWAILINTSAPLDVLRRSPELKL